MSFLYLFFLRGFFAFLFIPFCFVFFNDIALVESLYFDLFLKRSFLPFDKYSILICFTFFISSFGFVLMFYKISKNINIVYFYEKNNQSQVLNEVIYIYLVLFLITKVRLFFIPTFFDLDNWTNLILHNQISLITSQMFFPNIFGIAVCSLLLTKPNLHFFEKILLIILAFGAIFAAINLQSRIYILVLLLILIVFIFKHIQKKIYKNLLIGTVLTLGVPYVFFNSEFKLVENLFVIYDNQLNTYGNNLTTGIRVYERFILDLIGRLDVTHIINSWWNQGVIYDADNKQKWGRDIMITHHLDLKTNIGVPMFISFLPNKFIFQDFLFLIFSGFLVAFLYKINYLTSRNLGYAFFVAIMCKFCLSWPEKRIDGMFMQTLKPLLISIFPFIYFYLRTLIINRLKRLKVFEKRN